MTETNVEYVAMEPGFAKPPVGSAVKVKAVDWGIVEHQTSQSDPVHTIVRGTIYGQVIVVNDEWLTIAMQVFSDGGVRYSLSLPWVTVTKVTILEHGNE
jgi:hypothetical protein